MTIRPEFGPDYGQEQWEPRPPGTVITAMQEARLLPDGHWVHEVCPVRPS